MKYGHNSHKEKRHEPGYVGAPDSTVPGVPWGRTLARQLLELPQESGAAPGSMMVSE